MGTSKTLDAGLRKTPTGIEGFDQITEGGLPLGRTSIIMGGPGTGKTVFALQTLINGARLRNERGIFVAFEENSRQVIANAACFGYDLIDQDKLLFIDAGMSPDIVQTGRFDVGGLLSGIRARFSEAHTTRIVFDSIDVLLALLDDPFSERQELYRIQNWLAANEVTGILTARTSGINGGRALGHDFLEFMADCVVHLEQGVTRGIAHRELQVTKYRGATYHEGSTPMIINSNGIAIMDPVPETFAFPAFEERVSTGIKRLDAMLDGGYFRGSSVLLTGAPGTAKSTLAASFAEAASKRGERCLYVSFDESSEEMIRNFASVNLDLAPLVASGNLLVHAVQSGSLNAEQHLFRIVDLINKHQPGSLVIDPLSAVLKTAATDALLDVPVRLIHYTKSRGITMMGTSLVENSESPESTEMNASTIADTWIHLSFRMQAGERNRLLTIVKSRGSGHSNQARELVISNEGVTLADVYVAGGEVLMGTLRWEKEEAQRRTKILARTTLQNKERELSIAEAEIQAHIAALNRELEMRRNEFEALSEALKQGEMQQDAGAMHISRLRGMDGASGEPS